MPPINFFWASTLHELTVAGLFHPRVPKLRNSWSDWGTQAIAAQTMHVDGWSALLVAQDLPNRDRAGDAAYVAR